MTTQEILKADLLDIVFQNRNKSYGAYELRKSYGQRLSISLFFGIGAFVLLLLLIIPSERGKVAPDINFIPKVIPPTTVLPPPPMAKVASQRASASASYTNQLKLVVHTRPEVELNPAIDMQHLAIGPANLDGPPVLHQSDGLTEGSVNGKDLDKENAADQFIAVEVGPQFPGGADAWKNFLSRYLQVPEELAPGEMKRVLVQFQVGRDGSIDAMTILQSGGAVFDAEVLRVMKKMPRWKPAQQNGQPVAVTFTQPVTFVGIE